MAKISRANSIVIIIITLAVLLIIIAFCMPYFYSEIVCCNTKDLSGLVYNSASPFLAISGILMSFLAFFIQYQANEEQKKQITRLQEEKEQEIKNRKKSVLSLFLIDLKSIKYNAESWNAGLTTYKQQIQHKPNTSLSGYLVPSKYLERYKSIDRNLLKIAFDDYCINDDCISESNSFEKIYDIVERYCERVTDMYGNLKRKHDFFNKQFNEISLAFSNLDRNKLFIDTYNKQHTNCNSISYYDDSNNLSYEILCDFYKRTKRVPITDEKFIKEINAFAAKFDAFIGTLNNITNEITSYNTIINNDIDFFDRTISLIYGKLKYGPNWPRNN